MLRVGFETTIPVFEGTKEFDTLAQATTVIGYFIFPTRKTEVMTCVPLQVKL